MKRFCKIAAALLALALMLCACTTQPVVSATTAPAATQAPTKAPTAQPATQAPVAEEENPDGVTPKGEFPIVTEPYTMSVAFRLHANVEDINTNFFTQHLLDVTGVALEVTRLPDGGTEALQNINLMFASNEMPEVIAGVRSIASSVIWEYAQAGQLTAINEYIDKYAVGLPQNKARLRPEDAEMIDTILTMPDGNIYTMPFVSDIPTDKHSMMTWVYMPWLEKLNIEKPKTLDDFYNMCMAFKTQDPNGNGIADEIPVTNSKAQANRIVSYIGNCFQYTDWEWFLKVNNGKVESWANTPEYRQTLEYIKKMIDDGLIDPQMYTQENADLKASFAQGDLKYGVVPYASPSGYMASSEEPMRSFDIIDALEGPTGVKLSVNRGIEVGHSWLVTSACKLPAVAVRVADYCASEEGWNYFRYGEKGVDWEDPTGTDIMGNPASIKILQDIYGMPSQNKIWRNNDILYFYDIRYLQRQNDAMDYKEYEAKKYIGSQMLMKSIPAEAMPFALKYPNVDDEATVAKLKSELKLYIEEMQAVFVMGNQPLDDASWNAYVSELEVIGIQKYIDAAQRAYDNMK